MFLELELSLICITPTYPLRCGECIHSLNECLMNHDKSQTVVEEGPGGGWDLELFKNQTEEKEEHKLSYNNKIK